ncbi:hypothetical protein [Piscinibacter defluvii]|uniref:hypothetical protein n=1 Tax=Piscinibacter defluvii TaxID=1796922 RepID=UPI000FDEB669|nr:hypothetical protein [Piscinibacter defluvii]
MRPLVALAVLALGAWLPLHAAQPPGSDAQERARIAAERRAAESAYAEQVRECQGRFAVTPCIEEARAARREKLIVLRRQQALLDEAQRKQRAAERMATIRDKVSAEESRQRQPAGEARAREAPMRIVAPRAGRAAVTPAAPASAASAARSAAEERKRARYEARQREAQAHREDAQRRAAERAASGKKPSAPLPPASAP